MQTFTKWLEMEVPPPYGRLPDESKVHGQGRYALYYNGRLRRRTDNLTIVSMFANKGWKVVDTSKTQTN